MENKDEITAKILAALEKIRPYLQADGGDIALVGVSDDLVVRVSLKGACRSCTKKYQTLRNGVEYTIKQAVPEVKRVIGVS